MLHPVWLRHVRWAEPACELWSATDLLVRRSFTYSNCDSNSYGHSHRYVYAYADTNTHSYSNANADTYTESNSHTKTSTNAAPQAVVEVHCRQ